MADAGFTGLNAGGLSDGGGIDITIDDPLAGLPGNASPVDQGVALRAYDQANSSPDAGVSSFGPSWNSQPVISAQQFMAQLAARTSDSSAADAQPVAYDDGADVAALTGSPVQFAAATPDGGMGEGTAPTAVSDTDPAGTPSYWGNGALVPAYGTMPAERIEDGADIGNYLLDRIQRATPDDLTTRLTAPATSDYPAGLFTPEQSQASTDKLIQSLGGDMVKAQAIQDGCARLTTPRWLRSPTSCARTWSPSRRCRTGTACS